MKTIPLGRMAVSAQGLGCKGMSGSEGPADWDESTATIRRALDLGVTLIDTADVYGAGHNEVLVGRAIAGRRDQAQVATKVGVDLTGGGLVLHGEPSYIRRACDASLLRLGVEAIDIYYLHRPPQTTHIEESIGAMAELVAAGKVRHLGLSEVSDGLLRRAHAVHPITAVQSEYSLCTRDPETSVIGAMRELGVGLVAHSPLGRGFLAETLDAASHEAADGRRGGSHRTGPAAVAKQAVVDGVRAIADARGATPAQIALAWVSSMTMRLGVPVVPIPGTKHVGLLEQNARALDVRLTTADLAALDALSAPVVGGRR